VPAVARVAGVRLVAVADRDPGRCAAVAPGAAAHASAEALVAAGDVDAVVVASPAGTHLAAARAAASAGLPSLVEKPPAPDADAARVLASLRPQPWIGFNRRFFPSLRAFRGREAAHFRVVLTYRRASWQPLEVQDEAVLDLGPHAIDLVRWLGDTVVRRVRARALSQERCELQLELDGGTASVSCAADRVHRELFEARDASGSLLGRDARGGVARGILARLRPPAEHTLVESLAAELEAFCAAVQGRDHGPLATAEDGVAAMEVVDAARRSSESGGAWVAVPAG
jgi:predicted dehydrogenase